MLEAVRSRQALARLRESPRAPVDARRAQLLSDLLFLFEYKRNNNDGARHWNYTCPIINIYDHVSLSLLSALFIV